MPQWQHRCGLLPPLLSAPREESLNLRFVNQDLAPAALPPEAVVRKNPLGTPLINQRIADPEPNESAEAKHEIAEQPGHERDRNPDCQIHRHDYSPLRCLSGHS